MVFAENITFTAELSDASHILLTERLTDREAVLQHVAEHPEKQRRKVGKQPLIKIFLTHFAAGLTSEFGS